VKAFTERDPKVVGLIALAILTVLVLAVVFFNRGFFRSGYEISARFPGAAGIDKGTQVLLAGVAVGTVDSVEIDGNAVDATMTINHGVVLPRHTAAAIEVETLLGVVDVSLQPVSGWDHPLRPGALLTDTSMPTEFYQLSNTAGHLLQHTDATALNSMIESLAAITKGKEQQVAEIVKGLGALTTTVNQRSSQVSQLVDSANTLSSTLAGRDQQLTTVIDSLNTVAAGLADHSSDLANLIDEVDAMATQTNGLVGDNQGQLNSLINNLNTVLGVVGHHQDDLAEAVSYLGSALKGFASVGYSGPSDTPNSWANIYANTLGITGTYGALGPCGALDQALDRVLGPTPLACDEQTGPLPGTTPSNDSPGPATDGGQGSAAATGASSSGSGTTSGSTAAASSGPDSGIGGLAQLLGPLAGGGA
jgi:phospholipid/cholesterol/gamma-HCH transport system substrate-binding protein